MTRSRCRSKSRSNRLKRNKTKRYRQTKNKRRRQHGGTFEYKYTPGIENIFKPGQVTDPVLIPGYREIMDMMQEYDDPRDSNSRLIDQSKKLNDGIKIKNVEQLSDCSLPQNLIPEGKIIVVRKAEKSLLGTALGNNSIECNSEQYYDLASHNFRIFIRDILKWNPFLNSPKHTEKPEHHQVYGGVRQYSLDKKFKETDWWNKQSWWTDCKETIASVAQQSLSQTPSPAAAPRTEVDVTPLIRPLQQSLNKQLTIVSNSINNSLKLTISSLQELIQNSKERYKYDDIKKIMETLDTNVKKLVDITPQIDALLATQQQSS